MVRMNLDFLFYYGAKAPTASECIGRAFFCYFGVAGKAYKVMLPSERKT